MWCNNFGSAGLGTCGHSRVAFSHGRNQVCRWIENKRRVENYLQHHFDRAQSAHLWPLSGGVEPIPEVPRSMFLAQVFFEIHDF